MPTRRISLDGRVAIVTGGGRGLGKAYALDLAARGAAVVVNSTGETAEAVAAEIRAHGGRAVADVRSIVDEDAGAGLVETALETFGRVDAVVNNAGIVVNAAFEETTLDQLDALYAVHLRGAFALTRAAFAHLARQGHGRIVFISSASGALGLPGQSAYGALKSAVIGLSNVVALEGRAHGVLSNAVLPMAFTNPGRTASTARLRELLGDRADAMAADHVAGLVTYLCSDACTVTRHAFSAVAGRIAVVATGVGEGWLAPAGRAPSAEDIEAALPAILDTDRLLLPGSLLEEVEAVAAAAGREEAGR